MRTQVGLREVPTPQPSRDDEIPRWLKAIVVAAFVLFAMTAVSVTYAALTVAHIFSEQQTGAQR